MVNLQLVSPAFGIDEDERVDPAFARHELGHRSVHHQANGFGAFDCLAIGNVESHRRN